ncbi:hypothetical protein [Streptomyces sp. NPDC002044]|uniref:hypothetical protein n=1 Tax=Streptomyces sp. NPDC002044 TaxID=3154662 RepID=UPI0033233FE9
MHFTAEDLFNVTFASEPLPLVELAMAVVAAQRADESAVFGRWRARVGRDLPRGEHTRTLRAAGLITTERDGKAVPHSATGLGVDLLHSGG